MVADVSTYLGSLGYDTGQLSFVTAKIKDRTTNANLVRAAQQSVMESHPRGAWFDTEDLGLFDGTHYDVAGVNTIGERFATSFQAIPEPSSLCLVGLTGLALVRRRRPGAARS